MNCLPETIFGCKIQKLRTENVRSFFRKVYAARQKTTRTIVRHLSWGTLKRFDSSRIDTIEGFATEFSDMRWSKASMRGILKSKVYCRLGILLFRQAAL